MSDGVGRSLQTECRLTTASANRPLALVTHLAHGDEIPDIVIFTPCLLMGIPSQTVKPEGATPHMVRALLDFALTLSTGARAKPAPSVFRDNQDIILRKGTTTPIILRMITIRATIALPAGGREVGAAPRPPAGG